MPPTRTSLLRTGLRPVRFRQLLPPRPVAVPTTARPCGAVASLGPSRDSGAGQGPDETGAPTVAAR